MAIHHESRVGSTISKVKQDHYHYQATWSMDLQAESSGTTPVRRLSGVLKKNVKVTPSENGP